MRTIKTGSLGNRLTLGYFGNNQPNVERLAPMTGHVGPQGYAKWLYEEVVNLTARTDFEKGNQVLIAIEYSSDRTEWLSVKKGIMPSGSSGWDPMTRKTDTTSILWSGSIGGPRGWVKIRYFVSTMQLT